jgi:hypothetical protein
LASTPAAARKGGDVMGKRKMNNQDEIENACDMLEDQIEILVSISDNLRLNGGFISDVEQAIEHLNSAIIFNTLKERKANS